MNLHYGIVENRQDPLSLGRCQVRIVGLHTHDKSLLPTADLPWATPVQPVTSAAMNGIGHTPIGPVEGTSVIILFADHDKQQPIILGTLGGIPSTPLPIDAEDGGAIVNEKIESITLRTIPGPVTGKVLTFIDNEEGRVDLTRSLKANMKVVGFGIPNGTTIVSINNGTQITISSSVVNYAENIITFEAVPTNLDAVNRSRNANVLTDSSGNPVTTGFGGVVTTIPDASPTVGASPTSNVTNNAIPTIPPPKSVTNTSKATQGIKALIAACDKVGLTTKEQKCALLGIAGGETGWIPQLESYNYTPSRMKAIYSFATEDDISKYSNAAKRGLSRSEFFSWAYGPTKRGKGFLGNQTDEDGGKYFGRGFIQLTGKGNYQKYQTLANNMGLSLDIVNNPDSLDDDINVSALVAALYIKDRVSSKVNANAHPGYFQAAKSAVGVNSPDISARKLAYYEYFYGAVGDSGSDKDASAPIPEPPADGSSPTPGPSEESKASGSDAIGFRDPNNKYPLKEYIDEPDTNRLARGIINGTVVKKKDAVRRLDVPKALDNGSWDQPEPPYGAKYPYNKVYETESGHIQEFDDTPGQERIHTYHRSGTFSEIDANGTQVNYIVGDNFTIMERNGCIRVAGECNITVDGNTNIYARSDANIQVEQNATIQVGNNLDIGVANDITLAAGGDFKLNVVGDYSVHAANIYTKSDGVINIQSATAINQKSEAVNIQSSGDMNILAGGTLSADYAEGQFGNGAGSAADVEDFTLTPPVAGKPLNPTVPYFIPPERAFEERTTAETPDDWDTPEGRAISNKESRENGVAVPVTPVAEESAIPSGGAAPAVPVDCKVIYNTTNFTNDYRLSTNFTLGMLIDGGVNGKHKLVDQMLQDTAKGQLRQYTVQEVVCNLAMVAQNILEPMLEILPGGIGGYKKTWKINSGYRLKGVVPQESPTSDHCKGQAVDIGLVNSTYDKLYNLVVSAEKILPYDQIILEYRYPSSHWMHVSYKMDARRKMAFTMLNDKTYKRNTAGVPQGFYLLDQIPQPSRTA
jgi:predicted chitinase